jgi:phage-related protein
MNGIKNLVTSGWNAIKSTVTSVGNAIKSAVQTVWNNIKSAVSSAMTNVFNTVKSGFANVKNHITGLASQAFNWGKDLIMGIVNGIRSCISAVGDAVSAVADKIKSFLHFSVPDEGPLTDYESWMPDFMKGLADGIEKSRGLISKAMGDVSADMMINPVLTPAYAVAGDGESTGAETAQGMVSAIREAVQGLSAPNGDIVIPVYVGGTMLDEVIVNAQQRMNLRSGGR